MNTKYNNFSHRARSATAKALIVATLGVMPASTGMAQSTGTPATQTSSISTSDLTKDLKLSESQLYTYLGIGNVAPNDAKTYVVGQGWCGSGSYKFVGEKNIKTPYLTAPEQLNNWYYVVKKTPRDAPEKNSELQSVAPEVKKAVDDAAKRSKASKSGNFLGELLRDMGKGPGKLIYPTQAPKPVAKAPITQPPAPATELSATVDANSAPGQVTVSDPVKGLNLTQDQLSKWLGIGNVVPSSKSFKESEGWQGAGKYTFEDTKYGKQYTTPYIDQKQQLNDWVYVISGKQRVETEKVPLPVSSVVWDAVEHNKATKSANPFDGLKLTQSQFRNELGKGNEAPYGAKTYSEAQGWQGQGTYDFDRAKYRSPFLLEEKQFNNLYYVLYRTPPVSTKSVTQTVTPEVTAAVDGRK